MTADLGMQILLLIVLVVAFVGGCTLLGALLINYLNRLVETATTKYYIPKDGTNLWVEIEKGKLVVQGKDVDGESE